MNAEWLNQRARRACTQMRRHEKLGSLWLDMRTCLDNYPPMPRNVHRAESSHSRNQQRPKTPAYLKDYAAENRENATPASRLLAGCLRNMNIELTIWTEHAIQVGNRGIIFDLFFPELNLAIEVDGGSHRSKQLDDTARDLAALQVYGIVTLRVRNSDIFYHRKQVLANLYRELRARGQQLGIAIRSLPL